MVSLRRLGNVVDRLTNGYVGPTRDIYVEHGVPYLLARHVRDGRLAFDGRTFVSEAFNSQHQKSMLRTGDVVLVQSGHIGHAAVVNAYHDGHNCHAMIIMTPVKDVLMGEYLSYFFRSSAMVTSIEAIRSGSTVPHLTCAAIRELSIPVVSMERQRRIVAILDEAFEGIAATEANAYGNLRNAHELATAHLEAAFTSKANAWPERALKDVANIVSGYAFKSADFQPTLGVKSVKITNVGIGEFVADDGNYLPLDFAERYGGFRANAGSIVLALTRTISAGGLKVAVVPAAYDGALVNQRVAAITPKSGELATAFLFAYLSTRRVAGYVKDRVNTLMQPNLSVADLRALPVPIPEPAVQLAIADQMAKFQLQARALECVYRRKLSALGDLKKSLLHQAFTCQR